MENSLEQERLKSRDNEFADTDTDFSEDDQPENRDRAPAASPFEAQDELDAAERVVKFLEIGRTVGFRLPFSSQLKHDTEAQFPEDAAFYMQATKSQNRVLRSYFFMRVSGIIAFAGFIYAYLLVASEYFAESMLPATAALPGMPDKPTLLVALAAAIGVAAIGVLIRFTLRYLFFLGINTTAHRLGFLINQQISDINTRVTECCAYSQVRRGAGAWADRGKKWIKVAIWNAKRAEYLDRFSSTVGWLVRLYVTAMELVANAIMIFIGAVAAIKIFSLGSGSDPVATFLFIALLAVTIVWGWIIAFRRSDDFWTQEIRDEIVAAQKSSPHYFDQISSVTENLIEMIVANERNPSSRHAETS